MKKEIDDYTKSKEWKAYQKQWKQEEKTLKNAKRLIMLCLKKYFILVYGKKCPNFTKECVKCEKWAIYSYLEKIL